MQITKDKKNLIIKVPLKQIRTNPYDEMAGIQRSWQADNIIGIIEHKNNYDECGFAQRIDRSYKGKSDDVSSPFLITRYDKKEFQQLCKKLEFEIVYFDFTKDEY